MIRVAAPYIPPSVGNPWLYPSFYGASDAADDNAGPLQAWLFFLKNNPAVTGVWPGLAYKCNSALTLTGINDLSIEFKKGATLNVAAWLPTDLVPSMTALSLSGAIGSGVAITAPVTRGQKVIPVVPGTETVFVAGMQVKLASTDMFDPARSHSPKAEMIVVESVASGAVTLRTRTIDSYDTDPALYPVTPARLQIDGQLKILGTRNASHAQLGLVCNFISDSHIVAPYCDGVPSINTNIVNALDVHVYEPVSIDAVAPVTGYAAGFGGASRSVYLHGGYSRNVRHMFTVGSAADPQGGGVVRDFLVEDLTGDAPRADGVDTHGNFDRGKFRNLICNDAGGQGLNTEGGSIDLDGITIRRAASTGINLSSGANDVKTNISAKNIVVESCGGRGINIGTALHPDFPVGSGISRPEPAGIGTVNLSDFRVMGSALAAVRIRKPPNNPPPLDFVHRPEIVRVSGGRIEDCAANICVQLEYIDDLVVSDIAFRNVLATAAPFTLIETTGCIRDCNATFQSGASNAVIALTACPGVEFGGIKAVAPSVDTLRGVAFGTDSSGIRSLGNNDFSQCSLPYTQVTLVPVGGVLTIPAVIKGLIYRIGDNATPYDVHTIAGLRSGDRITLAALGPDGPITFRQRIEGSPGTGNLQLADGRDVMLTSTRDNIELLFDTTPTTECRQLNLVRARVEPITFTTDTTLPLYLDRTVATYFNNSTDGVFTLPAAFQRGFEVDLYQIGANKASFVTEGGAPALENVDGHASTGGPGARVKLKVRAATGGMATWVLSGDTAA